MIIKKPYAFLIRHFRIIHLILFGLMTYLAYKSTSIFQFFNNYVKEETYFYQENLASYYINIFMLLIVILVIVIAIVIYWLMKWKDKPRKYYIFTCVFYLLLLIFLIVFYNTFITIQNQTLDIRIIRAYRDIALMAVVPQYIFLAFALVRGAGFNIRKFDFSKDLNALDISEEDAEEIELTLTNDTYKYKRSFKRWIREFKYYLLENKFMFIIITSTMLVIIVIVIYFNMNVYNKIYKMGESFSVDGIVFNVTEAYLSDTSYRGDIITENKIYIIVSLEMKNTTVEEKALDLSKVRLLNGEKNIRPILSKYNYFIDYGEGYNNNLLRPGETYNYLIIFELGKTNIEKELIFRIVDQVNYVSGEINSKYKDVNLVFERDDTEIIEEENSLNELINIKELDASIKILYSELNDSFVEKYIYCTSECYTGEYTIKPSIVNSSPKAILKLGLEYYPNDEKYYSKHIESNQDFIKYFGSIYYEVGQNKKISDVNVHTSKYINGENIYLEVPKEVKDATIIELYLTVRNTRYIVKLR